MFIIAGHVTLLLHTKHSAVLFFFSSSTHHFSHCLLRPNSEVKPSRPTLKQHKDYSFNQWNIAAHINQKHLLVRDLNFNFFSTFDLWTFLIILLEGIFCSLGKKHRSLCYFPFFFNSFPFLCSWFHGNITRLINNHTCS